MSQIVGGAGYQGIHFGAGPSGPMAIFMGNMNPNSIVDPLTKQTDPNSGVVSVVAGMDRVTASNCDVGSLFLQGGVGHWQKTVRDATLATSGTWVQVAVP